LQNKTGAKYDELSVDEDFQVRSPSILSESPLSA